MTSIRENERAAKWIVCLGLSVLVWAVFAQTLGYDFVNFDDNKYVYENPQVSRGLSFEGVMRVFTRTHANLWHPMTSISHMLDCQLYGLTPGGHHFTNVILHNVAVVLLFLVLLRMTGGSALAGIGDAGRDQRYRLQGGIWPSAFVAALFAIHPMRVESVAWIAERKDVLSAVFFMLTLGAYVRYVRKPNTANYLLVCMVFACGLMSKAMLVTTPVVLLLLDYWPLHRGQRSEVKGQWSVVGGLVWEKIPLFLLSAASTLVTIWAQKPAINSLDRLPVSWRVNNAFVSLVTYMEEMFWPTKLSVFYPHPHDQLSPAQIAISVGVIIAFTVLAVVLGRRHRYIAVGWFWYLMMVLPVIGLVQAGLQGHADRFTYLPYIGLFVIVAWGVAEFSQRWPYRKAILGVAASLIIAASALAAWRQTSYWHDSLSLWSHALAVTSNNDTAELCMASALLERGRLQEAIGHSQAAVRIRVENAGAFGKVPVVLTNEQTQAAVAYLQKRIEANPEDVDAHNNLGVVLVQSGAVREAVSQWQTSLKIKPNDGNAANNLAWVLATSPDDDVRNGLTAVDLAEMAARLPGGDNPMVLRTLAAAFAENNRFDEATKIAGRAAEMAATQQNPSLAETLRRESASYADHKPHRETLKPQ